MWTNLIIGLFIVYAWWCGFEYFRYTCAMNRRFEEKLDIGMGRE